MDNDGIRSEMLADLNEEQAGKIEEILLNSREQCEMFQCLIENQINVKDAMITKLHNELEYYKQDSADKFINQVVKNLVKVHQNMTRRISANDWEELDAETVRKEYKYIFEDLTDFLQQQNVDSYTTPQGQRFDPAKHQAKIEVTDDEMLDKTIKESISDGYIKGDKILIAERVVVYQKKEN